MGLKNVIAEFFSAESGQERRQWLTGKEEQFGNALGYALGPDLAPRVNALAQAGAMVSPGADVMEAQQAGRDMFAPDRSIMDRAASGAAMAGAGAMMLMPGGASSVRQGVESVVDAGVRAYDPNTLNIFAGPRAATADAGALTRAQDMVEAGASRDEIWDQTGWFRGVDGQWRFEIDDSAAESAIRETAGEIADGIIEPGAALTLGGVLDHAALFKAYPSLDDVPTSIVSGQTLDAIQPGAYGGVTRGGNLVFRDDITDAGRPLHEVQHLIQRAEGFSPGGDPRSIGMEDYWKLSGEVEARNVTGRAGFDAAQRSAAPPWKTQDVSDTGQVVSYNDGPQADIPQTPAQEIARLLSEGRANEVTDELYAQADPQELHQLYTSGATGVDMPMDTPSRMARADEMGFDSDAFHGTTSDFAAPKAGMDFYTTPNFDYANIYAGSQFDEGGRVLPVMQRQGAILDTRTADGRQTFDDGFFMQYGNGTPITDKGVPDWTEGPDFGEMFSDNNLPYAGVFLDEGKVPLGDGTLLDRGVSTLHLDPSNIRSKFARFDPRLSNLRNLSAGVAGAGAVGLAAQSRQPEERRELPPLAPELAFMKDIYR